MGVKMSQYIVLFIFLIISTTAQSATLRAKNTTELLAALSRAKGGDVIKLAKGNYSSFSLNGTNTVHKYISRYSSEVIIESESTSEQAIFPSIKILAGINMTFRNITFQSTSTDNSKRLVDLGLVTNIKFIGVKILGKTLGGYGRGFGIYVGSTSSGLIIENSNFRSLNNALNVYSVNGLRVSNSNFTNINYDVVQMAYVSNVLVENNLMVKNSDPNNDIHQDLIQIANSLGNSRAAASNITIRANRLESTNAGTHGIFIDNQKAKSSKNKDDFYRSIVIENNDIYSSQALGIAVAHTIGVVVRGNQLLQHPNGQSTSYARIPQVRMDVSNENVSVENNTGPLMPVAAGGSNWTPTTIPAAKGWVFSSNTVNSK